MVLAFPLSPEEEENILNKYSLICWKVVNRFVKQRKSSIFDKDDLYQECMLVLVRHMQRCKTPTCATAASSTRWTCNSVVRCAS